MVKRKSLSQQVADTIYHMIVEEKVFQPGDQLPNENELSEQLGVSRATLREASRILVSQGILEIYRGKGTFIAQDMKAFGDFGLENLERIRIRLKDLYEARLLFEPELTAIACRRATDEEIAEILRIGVEVEQTIHAGKDRTEIDQAFHRAIVTASHNDFMMRLIPIINRAVEESILLNSGNRTLAEDTLRDHALVMDFLKKRDCGGAKQAMSIHIHHAISTLNLNLGDDPIF